MAEFEHQQQPSASQAPIKLRPKGQKHPTKLKKVRAILLNSKANFYNSKSNCFDLLRKNLEKEKDRGLAGLQAKKTPPRTRWT